jgi:hypothetical protein
MKRLLAWHVLSEMTVCRVAWFAAFALGATCTTLVLKMLPEFGVLASVVLVSSVALAWIATRHAVTANGRSEQNPAQHLTVTRGSARNLSQFMVAGMS